jgi:hypothetical protein
MRMRRNLSAPTGQTPSTTIIIDLRILQTTLDFPFNTAIFDSPFRKVCPPNSNVTPTLLPSSRDRGNSVGGDGDGPCNDWLINCAARCPAEITEPAVFVSWFEVHLPRYFMDVVAIPSCGDRLVVAEYHANGTTVRK